ncbi:MAG: hypothetical protein AAF589_04735 [Planctomycetota bacterium]
MRDGHTDAIAEQVAARVAEQMQVRVELRTRTSGYRFTARGYSTSIETERIRVAPTEEIAQAVSARINALIAEFEAKRLRGAA